MVDGFRFQSPKCRHYFLTHYHADHTTGAPQASQASILLLSLLTTWHISQSGECSWPITWPPFMLKPSLLLTSPDKGRAHEWQGTDPRYGHAGLNSGFSAGTIYCSHVTSNLLIRDMRVNPSCIRALPLDAELVIEGIRVTLIDANHCPGAVLLLFKTPPPKGSVFSYEVTPTTSRNVLLVSGVPHVM